MKNAGSPPGGIQPYAPGCVSFWWLPLWLYFWSLNFAKYTPCLPKRKGSSAKKIKPSLFKEDFSLRSK